MILRASTATLLLAIALAAIFGAASLPAIAQDVAATATKPTPHKARKTVHAPKKQTARHGFVKPKVMRTPPVQTDPVSSKDTGAPIADHPPNEFHFGEFDATVHGDLNIGVGGRTR